MLLIAGSVRIDATHRDELIATAIEVLRELRKQDGCTHVALSADLEDRGVLHLLQRWESRDALRANIAMRPLPSIAKHAGKIGVREMALLSYDVVAVGPVGPGNARHPSTAAIGIAIVGELRIDPARRSDAIARAIEFMSEARGRKGCSSFVMSIDLEDSGLVRLFGEWEDRSALRALVAGPDAAAARKRFEAMGVREIDFERFDVRSVGPIV